MVVTMGDVEGKVSGPSHTAGHFDFGTRLLVVVVVVLLFTLFYE